MKNAKVHEEIRLSSARSNLRSRRQIYIFEDVEDLKRRKYNFDMKKIIYTYEYEYFDIPKYSLNKIFKL